MTRHDDRCDAPGCTLPATFAQLDGGPGRWCTVHAGGDTTPAAVFAWEVDRARGRPTWWLHRRERRLARGHQLAPRQLATRAAVRSMLRERHVDLPDTDNRTRRGTR